MARKNYQVIAKDAASWQRIHNDLTSITFNTTNVPDRPCLCKNETKHSETRGTYQLSVSEVEELRKNSDVAAVFVDPNYHPDTDKYECTPCSLRFGKNVKNYRTLFSVANNEYTEVASSLMSITGQLNQGTTNWVLVKNAHSGTAAMNYWQSMGFPLIYDYGVYPSAPTNASDPDPLRNATQTGANLVTISNTGYYELEVACDGEYGAVWTDNYPKVPLITTDDLTKNTDGLPSTFPDNIWGKDRKDPRNQGIGYRIIQLGKLNAGTITINFEVRNGNMSSGAETWDRNPGCIAWKLRFLGNMNIRELGGGGNAGASTFVTHIPQDNPTSADHNRTGYQILRCAEGTSTNPWSDTRTQISQDISYTNDGTDVDCIMLDNGVWTGHPEFVTDDEDPQHYITGNILSRHSRSGVLDILLDAPYYLDPEYFNANASYLETRWDGTIVPTENAARAWWLSASNRSNSFTDFGSITVPSGYSRARHCGTESTPPTNNSGGRNGGGHGTPCASLMYGKNYGWAFNSNKWTLSYPLGQLDAPADDACLDAIKVFHQYKPTNPKHGTQDPTVTNCSFGTGSMLGRINFDKTYYGRFQFQPSGNSWNPANDVTYDQADYNDNSLPFNEWGSQPDFMRPRVMGAGAGGFPAWLNPGTTDSSFPSFYAMREAANAGVVFVAAAGNDGMYRATDNDPNFWNARTYTPTSSCDTENDNCGYTNRGGWPCSHNFRLNITNPSGYATDNFQEIFVIGAMDDQLLGDMRKSTSSDALLKDTGTRNTYADSCEITANNLAFNCDVLSPFGSSSGQHGDNRSYSNVGPLIDFYAPADSTLAASTYDNVNTLFYTRGHGPIPQHPSTRTHPGGGSYKYRDGYFNGTSAAAPVAAGLLACILQQNRGWLPNVLKANVKNGISNATNWYKGFAPNGAFDLKWLSQYDTKGEDVKVIKEWSSIKTTPNPSYETTSGISPSRPNLNERFSITTSGTSVTVKIVSIREFSSSDAGSPSELRIANGWYPVQIVSTSTSSSTLANYKMRIKSGSNDQVLEISSDGGSLWNGFNISTVNGNFQTDGSGRFWYYLNVDDSVGLPQQPSNPTYVINLSPSTNVNEGSTLVTTITTTDVSNGTTLYWRLDGTGITSADFSSGSLTGSGSVNSQGSFQFSHTLANDLTTEGIETLNVKLFTDAARQIQVASTSIQINDTSVAQAYAISPSKTTPNEGESFTYGIGTSGVVNGTTLYWEITGSVMSSADFTPSSLTGSVTINNNSAAVTKTINEDLVTEGNERINFKVYTDAGRTNEVASNNSVVIQDTSTAPTTPTYNITPSNTTLDEGDSFTITVTTTNVSPGTTLYWKINEETGNISTSDIVGGTLDGSASVNSQGTFLFSKTLADDITTEGEEKFTVKLYTDATFNLLVASTPDITINDTSQSKTYSLSASSTTINEGSTVTTTVTTTNVSSGTALYWELSGTGITSSDFSSGSLTGSGSVNAQGTFNFSHTLDNDVTLEGSETIAVRLYTDSGRTTQVGNTLSIVVNDTSIPQATYSISPNPTSVNEGSSFTTTVTTSNVANGTTLYWALEGTNIDGNDFSTGALSGSGSISNNTFNFTHTLSSDATTEGTETCSVKLYVDSARTVKVAEASVTINDTSQTPSTPTYVISPSNTSINEGETFTTTVTTSNVADGTTLYWQLDQHTGTINAGDFSSGALNGSGTTSSSQFNFQHTVAADTTTEGEEKFAIVLATDAGFNNIVATSALITINDTSTDSATPTYALSSNLDPVNEGQFLAITVTTTNVASNTTLYWQFSGTNITASDFNEGTLESNIVTDATGSKAFGTTLRNDILTEGSETMLVKLFTDSGRTTQVGNTLSITINDTSTSQAPTYSVSPSVTQLNEGQSFTTTVTTTNINDGTTLYWVVESHTGTINAGDFSSGALSGSGSISSGGFAFSHTIAEDATTEGTEKILIKLYTDSGLTNNVANTSVITIFDTSTTSNPVYVLSTPESIIKEGDTFTTTVATTNVVDSTDLWWKLEGINSSDLTTGSIEGQGTVISNTFSFSHALAKDMAEEGTEIIQIKLYSDSARNNQVGNTLGVSVKDTSQPGFNVDVTAPNNNEYILIGNDTDGTI